MGRYKKSKEQFKKDLIKKYGSEIIDDFDKACNEVSYSLSIIARKYKITRARTSQMFFILYEKEYRIIQKQEKKKVEDSIPILERYLYDRRNKFRQERSHKLSPILVKCEQYHYIFKIQKENTLSDYITNYDFTINGKSILIKTASISRKYGTLNRLKYFHFNLSKKEVKKRVEYIICHVVPYNIFYIVPFTKRILHSIYIPDLLGAIPGNNFMNPNSKYKEAWYLFK